MPWKGFSTPDVAGSRRTTAPNRRLGRHVADHRGTSHQVHHYAAARQLLHEALTIAELGDDHELVSSVLYDQGFVALKLDELDRGACLL